MYSKILSYCIKLNYTKDVSLTIKFKNYLIHFAVIYYIFISYLKYKGT